MMTRALTAFLAIMLLAACGRYFAPDINLQRYATEKELIGTWSLTPQTIAVVKRDGYAPSPATAHEIIFREDGTCDFRSITGFAHNIDYLDDHGSWKLAHDTSMPDEKKKKNEVSIRIKE